MSKREDLARLLGKHYGTSAAGDDHLWAMADIIIDLLHPAIETVEELDALPMRSVVMDESEDVWQAYTRRERPDGTLRTYWECGEAVEASDDFAFPVTFLHEGSAK